MRLGFSLPGRLGQSFVLNASQPQQKISCVRLIHDLDFEVGTEHHALEVAMVCLEEEFSGKKKQSFFEDWVWAPENTQVKQIGV